MFYNLLIYISLYIYNIYIYIFIYITMDHRYIHHQVFNFLWSHLRSQRPAGSRGRRPHHIWRLQPSGDLTVLDINRTSEKSEWSRYVRYVVDEVGPKLYWNGLDIWINMLLQLKSFLWVQNDAIDNAARPASRSPSWSPAIGRSLLLVPLLGRVPGNDDLTIISWTYF